MTKIYISGAISKDPKYWKERFEYAHKYLNSLGYTDEQIVDPKEMTTEEDIKILTYKDFMNRDLVALSDCTSIYLLRTWKKSPGAKVELEYAKCLGLEIVKEKKKNAW